MSANRVALNAAWVVSGSHAGAIEIRTDATLVVEDGRIAGVTTDPVDDALKIPLPPQTMVMPGFVDLHTHSFNGPLFRGTTEDRPRGTDNTLVYDYLMPIGDLASQLLTEDEALAVYTLSLARILEGGTTTVLDMFRPDSPAFLKAAQKVGIRAYGAPYLATSKITGVDDLGHPDFVPGDDITQLQKVERWAKEFDDASGRIRLALGPHCTDTCSPELLHQVKRVASDLDAPITIHTAQSKTETDWMQQDGGRSPVEYLIENGICGPRVILAHCVFASDTDLSLLADTGTSVASCPATFAQGGWIVDHQRFADWGLVTGIGTDGYSHSYLDELRIAGVVSKLATGRPERSTAVDLLHAGTVSGASALGRSDLGTLSAGARADVVAITFDECGAVPVLDPVRRLVWHQAARIDLVMVDGEVLVRGSRHQGVDFDELERVSSRAIERVWQQVGSQLGLSPETG